MSPIPRRAVAQLVLCVLCLAVGITSLTMGTSFALSGQPEPQPTQFELFLPQVDGPPAAQVLISAAYIDSSISYEPDEAILLWNVGAGDQPLAGWSLGAGARRATFPMTTTLTLKAGERLWCAADGEVFHRSFGVDAGCTWASARENAEVLDGALTLPNTGGVLALYDSAGAVVDVLLYGDTTQQPTGWTGEPAMLYTRGVATSAGQVWQRKLDPAGGLPVDSDTARDWAGDLDDPLWGRRIRQPGWGGWDQDSALWPWSGVESTSLAVAVGPEGLFAPLAERVRGATTSLDLSLYTFEHPTLALLVADAASRGVRVRLLLDGAPPGGISDLQKWCVSQIAQSGADVRYLALADDAPNGYKRRFRFTHAKYGIFDDRLVFVGTENFTFDAMPETEQAPVGGRRGFYLLLDAAGVASALSRIFNADWRPTVFADLRPYEPEHPKYGAPPPEFVLPAPPIYAVEDSPFGALLQVTGNAEYAVASAPENAMRPDVGILALFAQTGAGDEITMMQLYENKYFGESQSNPIADPNPRLEAAINAARRGARVRLLLDSYFDEPDSLRSNAATVEYVRSIALSEGLDLDARTGNPTAGGIHAKLVLVHVGDRYWSAVGSLNGGETSHKLNREVVLMVEQREIYDRLYTVFERDWPLSE